MRAIVLTRCNKRAELTPTPADDPADDLAQALVALDRPDEARAFLADLCTPAELHSLAERWQVAQLLDAGRLTYRQIHEATGVSTTTIVRVARFLRQERNGGYRRVLDRLKAPA